MDKKITTDLPAQAGNSERKFGFINESDPRTFGVANVLGDVSRADLTDKDFKTCEIKLVHQLDSDHCVGESGGYGSQATENDPEENVYSGSFAFASSKGQNWNSYGMSVLRMCKGKIEHGVCIRKLWQLEKGKRDYYSNPDNIPAEAWENAKKHKAQSFGEIQLKADWDQFDLFRAYLNKFKDKKIVIHSGVDSHAITLNQQKKIDGEIKLGGPDSYGEESINYRLGKSVNGWRWFSRWEVNQLFSGYIIFDISRTLAELLNNYNGKAIKVEGNPDCYLVKNGQKHLLKNEAIAWANNVLLFGDNFVNTLPKEDFYLIPTGSPATFKEGKNWEIVQRMLEKTNNLKLIEE